MAVFITSTFSSCSFSDPEIASRLKNRKQTIDSNIANGTCASHSVAVLNQNQDINCYYQLYQDKSKSLMKVSETYTRNNTSSDTTFVYYFDENEYTFAFQVKVAMGSDSLFSSVTAFYNKNMEMVMKEYATIDNCDISVEGKDSILIDLTAYSIPPDVITFAQQKKIILQND
ncbi:hypothetical protein [uncultured Dysgonomonas sp.]|uniref:Uncharacterized protein n=1 Tax=uncultured Dysgonomonas sp. TaxID=206096 RepID=A0A212K358_9BACT|nr:hypothetical protein [uncultured Dysgonomonas sp.]SBW06077.1 conserved hypothetical protein [uncultured Dysgonomonas sp.]